MYTDIKVGYSCNNRCIHCVVEPSRRDLQRDGGRMNWTTEEVLGVIDEAKDRGSSSIVLTGGEVTLRKDFPQLMAHALCLGMSVAVQTNGRQLEAWDKLHAFDNICASFTVAVHAPNAEIHDSITRAPGSFDETIRGIQLLCRRSNISVTGKLVISKRNQVELCETLEMLAGIGVRRFNIAFPHAERFPPKDFAEVVPRYRELREELACCATFLAANRFNSVFETIPYCVTPNCPEIWERSLDAMLVVQGKNNPGFIRAPGDDSLHHWEKERKQIKHKSSRCTACLFDKSCEGPWKEYVEAYGDEELQPLEDPGILDLLR